MINKTIETNQKKRNIGEDRQMTVLISLAKKWELENWGAAADFLAFDDLSIEELLQVQANLSLAIAEQAKELQK